MSVEAEISFELNPMAAEFNQTSVVEATLALNNEVEATVAALPAIQADFLLRDA